MACLLLLLHATYSGSRSHYIVSLSNTLIQVLLLLEGGRLGGQVGLLINVLHLLLSSCGIALLIGRIIGCRCVYDCIIGPARQVHLVL